MRQILGTIMAVCLAWAANAQLVIKGTVTSSKTPIESATVVLRSGGNDLANQLTGIDGTFEFRQVKKQGEYEIFVKHVAYQQKIIKLTVTDKTTTVSIELQENKYLLEPLEVRASTAGARAPFAKQTISKEEITKNNLARDIPFLLDQTPSVVVNSDAGNGVGYTGLRIRGSDASRINVTLNGIPYNDAESQGTFFVDLPDFASSLSSIQIQRGVGTSTNGTGAFGATLNLNTNEFNEKSYAELNNSYGSFNTWKHTLKAGSGLLNNHFTIDARLSKISSEGYIDRASSDLASFYLSGAYITKKSTLRLNVFSGTEKTYQSWYGIDAATLRNNRTYNPAGTEKPGTPYDNQTDNYQQDHYQLFYNQNINNNWSFNTAAWLVNGKGYYEQYRFQNRFTSYGLPNVTYGTTVITRTDLVRQLWLDNAYYGHLASFRYKKTGTEITAGGGWSTYEGGHYGKVIWAQIGIPKDHQWYNLPALKKDANIYAKWQQSLGNHFELFTDLQYRHVRYSMNGFRDNPTLKIDRRFNFVNPKAGISYAHKEWSAYISYAVGQKEPNRDDFEAGATTQPNPEKLHDIEAGFERKVAGFTLSANLYYMRYQDQLVLTGKINDVGAYTRVNVPNSYRAGIELQATKTIAYWLNVAGNIAFSRNKIKNFTEYIDDYDNGGQIKIEHRNKDIAFSPNVVGGLTTNIIPSKYATVSLISKYVGRQYLDNTGNEARSLDPFYVQDVRLVWNIPCKLLSNTTIIAQVNNVFNRKYEPNGYTFSYFSSGAFTTENYYFPMAGTNYMLALNIRL